MGETMSESVSSTMTEVSIVERSSSVEAVEVTVESITMEIMRSITVSEERCVMRIEMSELMSEIVTPGHLSVTMSPVRSSEVSTIEKIRMFTVGVINSKSTSISEFVESVHVGSMEIWSSKSGLMVHIEMRSSEMGIMSSEAMAESVRSSEVTVVAESVVGSEHCF